MKKLTLAATIIASIAFVGSASAEIRDSHEESLIRICEAMQSDKPERLRAVMKDTRVSYKQVNEDLLCNGQNAIDFALLHNADKTAKFVASKTNQDMSKLVAKI